MAVRRVKNLKEAANELKQIKLAHGSTRPTTLVADTPKKRTTATVGKRAVGGAYGPLAVQMKTTKKKKKKA